MAALMSDTHTPALFLRLLSISRPLIRPHLRHHPPFKETLIKEKADASDVILIYVRIVEG